MHGITYNTELFSVRNLSQGIFTLDTIYILCLVYSNFCVKKNANKVRKRSFIYSK